jgi:hypothetical protein
MGNHAQEVNVSKFFPILSLMLCAAEDEGGSSSYIGNTPAVVPAFEGETLGQEEGRLLDEVVTDTMTHQPGKLESIEEAIEVAAVDPGFLNKIDVAMQEGEILASEQITEGLDENDGDLDDAGDDN